MGIGFTGGLDQSDILSDGTPFDGANIDAPISTAGQGVDWLNKTPKHTTGFTSSNGGTILDVNGSGYIISFTVTDGSSNAEITLDIDGTDIISDTTLQALGVILTAKDTSFQATVLKTSLYRFESGFTLIADNSLDTTRAGVTYVLD